MPQLAASANRSICYQTGKSANYDTDDHDTPVIKIDTLSCPDVPLLKKQYSTDGKDTIKSPSEWSKFWTLARRCQTYYYRDWVSNFNDFRKADGGYFLKNVEGLGKWKTLHAENNFVMKWKIILFEEAAWIACTEYYFQMAKNNTNVSALLFCLSCAPNRCSTVFHLNLIYFTFVPREERKFNRGGAQRTAYINSMDFVWNAIERVTFELKYKR